MAHQFDIARLRRARRIAAECVELYGDVAMPIFKRLDEETIEAERHGTVMARVRAIASSPLSEEAPAACAPGTGHRHRQARRSYAP